MFLSKVYKTFTNFVIYSHLEIKSRIKKTLLLNQNVSNWRPLTYTVRGAVAPCRGAVTGRAAPCRVVDMWTGSKTIFDLTRLCRPNQLIAWEESIRASFVPTTQMAVMDGKQAKALDEFQPIDIHFPEDDSSDEVDTSENGTQTVLTGKVKGKPSMAQKRETTVGIKTLTSSHKSKRHKHRIKFMDWKRFHRLKDIYDFIDELEKDYPSICTVSVIGRSVEGRDIKMLKISNSDANNSPVWMDAAIHPREWISTAVVTYVAEHIVKNFRKQSVSIKNKDWYIVPVLNPDGYEYSHTCNRMWRKNRACYNGECVGVDLNRNFSCGWGNNGEEGSSEDPTNVFYRGPAPFSEPETVAVRDTILGANTKFKVFLSFHSYFELIIFPWGFKSDPCPNYLRLLEGAMIMSRAIFDSTGYIYKVGTTKDMTYYACGTSIDWSYGVAKIPYSYMVELRSKKYKFRLPKDQIIETCIESWSAIKNLMDFVDQKD